MLLNLVRAANVTFNAATESPLLQCKDIDHCRTLQSIVYGCLSTVFLCTWTALHLNVPREPQKPSPFRRVWFMLGALVGPEVVFGFAYGDWTDGSEMLRKVLEHSPNCGWTETHALFALMGGFRLKYPDGETELMREDKFFDYVKDGTIDLPNISEATILERSKGDPIAKSITIIQTAWFVIQCIHRRSQRLPLTELEITTLGHTLMNFFIYWFWWYKPLGIASPIDVPSKKPRPTKKYLNVEGQGDKLTGSKQSSSDVVARFLRPNTGNQEVEGDETLNDVLSFMSHDETEPRTSQINELAEIFTKLPPSSIDDGGKITEIHNSVSPNSMYDKKTVDEKLEPRVDVEAVKVLPPHLSFHSRLGVLVYSVSDTDVLSLPGRIVLSVVFFTIAGAFGAMHCLAWNSEFPTRAEQHLWQISSLIVTIIGAVMMVVAVNDSSDMDFWENEKKLGPWIAIAVGFLYICARISLLVLALLQLRALPYAAFVTPSWSTFYPHIN